MSMTNGGLLLDETNKDQLANVSKGQSRPINSYDDIIGRPGFIFQKKMKINSPADEFRVTIANGRAIDVVQRHPTEGLDFREVEPEMSSAFAKKLDDVKDVGNQFAKHLKVEPLGVHAIDVA